MEYDNYLMHYGRKNQKWGIRNFQNYDGTWTELGKARRRAMSGAGEAARRVKKVLKKTGKVTAATIKRTRKAISDASERSRERKAAKAARKEEKIQKLVAKAMRNNDVETILKYASHMTNQQLSDAQNRANYISSLMKNVPEKKKSFAQKVATDIGKHIVDKSTGLAKTAINKNKDKIADTIKSKLETAAKQYTLNRLNKSANNAKSTAGNTSERFGYDELRRRQEESNSRTNRTSHSPGSIESNAYEYNRKLSKIGKIFSDTDGYSSTGRSNLPLSDDYSDFLRRLADDYTDERKKRRNNYVWHGMRTKRKRRRRR